MSSEVEDHSSCERVVMEAEEQFHEACVRIGDLEAHLEVATEALDVAVAGNGELEAELVHIRAERDELWDRAKDAEELAECHRNDYRQADADRRDAASRILDLEAELQDVRAQVDGLRRRAEDAEHLMNVGRDLVNRQLEMLEIDSAHVTQLIEECTIADGRWLLRGRVRTRDIYDILINRSDRLRAAMSVEP